MTSSKTDMRYISIISAIGLLIVSSRIACAQDAASAATIYEEAIYEEAIVAMQEGKYDVACPKLAQSLRLERTQRTLYALATCEADRGRLATALQRYNEFLWLHEHSPTSAKPSQQKRAQIASEQIAKLLIEVPRLILKLPTGAPKNVEVTRNADRVDPASFGVEKPVDPGDHIITTQVPGGPAKIIRVHMVRGEKREIDLEIARPPVVSVKPDKPSWQRTAGVAALGVGGAGLVGGVIAGIVARANLEEAVNNCGVSVDRPGGICNDTGVAALNIAKFSSKAADAGLITGAVGMGVGALLFLTAPKTKTPAKGKLVHEMQIGISASPFGAAGGLNVTW